MSHPQKYSQRIARMAASTTTGIPEVPVGNQVQAYEPRPGMPTAGLPALAVPSSRALSAQGVNGPVVILTGASRGIGLACAAKLLEWRCRVVTLSRSDSRELRDLQSKYPGMLAARRGDTSIDQTNRQCVAWTISNFGRIDAVILNAGQLFLGTTRQLAGKLDVYSKLMSVNFLAMASLLSHVLPHLASRKGKNLGPAELAGRAILVSSASAIWSTPGMGAYSATKAAVNSLGRTVAAEEPLVSVVCVNPGVNDTAMQDLLRGEEGRKALTVHDHKVFLGFKQKNTLLKPAQSALALASLALDVDKELSGEYVDWDDARVVAIVEAHRRK